METLKEASAYMMMGFFVGVVAFMMKLVEEKLIDGVIEWMQHVIDENPPSGDDKVGSACWVPWLIYATMAAIFGLLASLMTTYWGPGASGSGVAELVGYLNGINYPGFMGVPTLVTKIVGVTLAVCAKLCVGKEGPLAHIGANIGPLILYLPGYELFRNDETKRVFVAAGASAGVAVAFGAPIGGALFCYELSKPNTFWKFMMIWKVFLSCSFATFSMGLLQSFASG